MNDTPKWWHVSLIGCASVLIFILTYSAIMMIKTHMVSDVPSEGVVAIMAGLLAATLPAGLLWNRLTKVKVWEIEFELAVVAARPVEVPSELSATMPVHMGPSYIQPLLGQLESAINQTPKAKILTLNIDIGPAWWSTRVFLVAALAQQFTDIQQIVFLESCSGPEDWFIGSATPGAVRRAFAQKQAFLEPAYQVACVQNDLSAVGMAFTTTSFQQPDGEAKQQTRVTKQVLRQWLGRDLTSAYVDWQEDPSKRLLLKIVNRPEPFVALVQCGRLKLLVDRQDLSTRLVERTLA